MEITQIGLVMFFGALVAAAGLLLLFLRTEQAENVIRIGGQEFKISTPALVVLLAGVFVFTLPFIFRIENQKVISFQWPRRGSGPETTIPGSEPATSVNKEHEPNDQITTPNLISMGTTISGVVDGKEDRDFFRFRTGAGQGMNVRVILRPTSPGGFNASVTIYDNLENRVTDGSNYPRSEDSISFAFRARANSNYYAKVETLYSDGGPYELLIKEE
jgi:hypothetical protein